MRYITILQTVTSSKRLPAKALLPIGGIPLFLFCAKRLLSDSLVVATSDQYSDDIIANMLAKEKIKCFRGSRDDVLSRFINIIKNNKLSDEDTVIRCTADNPVVDLNFLSECKEIFENEGLDYLNAEPSDIKKNNWPKGLSIEFVKVKLLKESYVTDRSFQNKEHVTLRIKKNKMNSDLMGKIKKFQHDYKGLVVGVDYFKDYIKIANAFNKIDNPIRKSYRFLIESIHNEKN